MKFLCVLILFVIQTFFLTISANATKTSDTPLNFTVLFTDFRFGQMPMYSPGQAVSYNLTLENATSASYWGTDFVVNFPDAVTCTSATPLNSNCTLKGNRFACHWNDVYANQRFNYVVNCQVNQTAVCESNARTTASATTMKATTNNQGFIDFKVKCPTTPTPTPTSTNTYVPPTATYSPTATYVPPTYTPTYVPPTYTPTWVPTSTPTWVPTYTATPGLTPTPSNTQTPYSTPTPTKPECADGVDNDRDSKTDYPADPGCESSSDPKEGDDQRCATYSIEREVYERWSRTSNTPVTLREKVQVLPDGESLSCLRNAINSGTAQCLKYDNFNSCSDHSLKRVLRREGYSGACHGPSSLTSFLLNQACQQDQSCRECGQFLALNTYRSNDYPLGIDSAGVQLSEEHNPRFQLFIVDSECRLIRNPSEEQELNSCPAAHIIGYTYSQGRRNW